MVSVMVLSLAAWAGDDINLIDVKCVLNHNGDAKASADYKGRQVFFCCKRCSGKFEKDPEK
jgi:YHS domain-containing protein